MKKSIISRKNLFLFLGIFILGIVISFSNITSALTFDEVMQRSPAFHLLKDIYTVINGEYIPVNTSSGKINSSLIEITENLDMNGYNISNAKKIEAEELCIGGECRKNWGAVGGSIITYRLTAATNVTTGEDYCCEITWTCSCGEYCNTTYLSVEKKFTCPNGNATLIYCKDAGKDRYGNPYCECKVNGPNATLKAYAKQVIASSLPSLTEVRSDVCENEQYCIGSTEYSIECSLVSCEMLFQCVKLIDV